MENENIIRKIIRSGQQPTAFQKQEIKHALSMPFVPDEDAPELTPEQYSEMSAIARERQTSKHI